MKLIMRMIGDTVAEPVTLGQLRDQVRADDGADDAALLGYGIAARQLVEEWLGRPIMVQTVRGVAEAWPEAWQSVFNTKGSFELSMPVSSVDGVFYTNAAGVATEWTAGLWVARVSQGGVTRVRAAAGQDWPTLGDDPVITVNATAGWPVVPETIITAIAKLAAYLHAERDGMGDVNSGAGRLPRDIRDLVRPFRFGGMIG